MRADKILIGGVAAIGLYALYRMFRTDGGPSPTFDETGGSGTGAPPLPFALPPDNTAVLGDPIGLVQGRWYGGRVDSDAAMSVASVVDLLTRFGFGGLPGRADAPGVIMSSPIVYGTQDAAQGHVPDYAFQYARSSSRWFHARWTLPSGMRARPAWLPLLWASLPPSTPR